MFRVIKAASQEPYYYDDRYDVHQEFTHANGSDYVTDADIVEAVAYMWGMDYAEARSSLKSGEYTFSEIQRAITYYDNKH